MPSYRVEIGFESTVALSDFFILDDPTKGKLDAGNKLSGGSFFYDVTSYVQSITINRGKSRLIGNYTSGQASVEFNNNARTFDPTYTSSPFYTEIVPKRKIRIWMDNILTFVGIVDDWNLNYSVSGLSTATATASDAFAVLANRVLTEGSQTSQLSGARVNAVLDDPMVAWPVAERSIDAGLFTMGSDVIAADTDALGYLQLVESSEDGSFFIGKDGKVVFRQRFGLAVESGLVLSDDGTGIPYGDLSIVYGSELLYNVISLESGITSTAVTASDQTSQDTYGILELETSGLLNADDDELQSLANSLLNQYKDPEFRFEKVTINLAKLTSDEIESILNLELGDLVDVIFTPNNLPPAISLYNQIIGIQHDVSTTDHIVTLSLGTLPFAPFRLDSELFGKLDVNALA